MAGTFYNFREKNFIYAFKNYWFQAYMPDFSNMASNKRVNPGLDLVLRFGDSPVWDCRAESCYTVEKRTVSDEQRRRKYQWGIL